MNNHTAKRNVSYWAVSGPLALILCGSGLGAITQQDFLIEIMTHLGFPLFIMGVLGTWYVGAAVAIIVPGLPWVKEWAYAGVVFAMTGAFVSHVVAGDTFAEIAPSVVILSLAAASYLLRPASRRLARTTTQ